MKNHLELEIPEKYILKKKKKGPSGIQPVHIGQYGGQHQCGKPLKQMMIDFWYNIHKVSFLNFIAPNNF